MQIKLHDFFLGSSFLPRRFVISPPVDRIGMTSVFINNSKTIKGIRLIFSGLIEVHKVYLQCKAWLSSYCSFCVILNSMKVRYFRPGRRYISPYRSFNFQQLFFYDIVFILAWKLRQLYSFLAGKCLFFRRGNFNFVINAVYLKEMPYAYFIYSTFPPTNTQHSSHTNKIEK